jgi:tetratricopeptide (TPR) repeat protein
VNESQVFTHALKLATPAERAAYLDEVCAGNAELRAAVEALLHAHADDPGFLEQPAGSLWGTVDGPAAPALDERLAKAGIAEQPGMVLGGRYKLLQLIGEGGMGDVWLAEQMQPVQRKVALKIIKAGMDSRQVLARFEAERQALALMDHPNIAKVLDGGATESGRPFFVMELVKGMPITKYCDEHRLTPRGRLELFIPVCQAIQHAHQKAIIHRDIKPSNVLVAPYDGKPVVKVIDFGVAKATGQPLTEKTLFTEFGAVIGTLEYMSPEQAELNNQDIDTRSDVYSLGVLLYELLTGTTPLDRARLKKTPFMELLRKIREEEPPKPSTRLSEAKETLPAISAQRQMEPAKLARLVRGELDWIVMRALEKDRNRRYESASAFAADVEHYLNNETVQACPPSGWYRFGKFARRNRGAIAMTSAAIVALFLAMVGLAVNNWLVTREKVKKEEALDKALREKERADENLLRARKAVKDYLTEAAGNRLLKEADFHDLRRKLLESAIPFYQEFLKQQTDDPELEAERGRAYGDLAMVREDLNQLEQALADHEQRRVIFERLVADFPAKPAYRHELAQTYRNEGNVHLWLSQPAKAEGSYREAITILDTLTADYPAAAPYREELAGASNNLGISLRALGRLDDARKMHQKALDLCERLASEFPKVPRYRMVLSQSYFSLGRLFIAVGQHDNALTSIQRAIDSLQKLAAEFPTAPEYREHWAGALNNKSVVLNRLGRPEDGLAAQQQALRIQEKLAADFASLPGYRRDVAESRLNLGHLLMALGHHKKGLACLDMAVETLDRLVQQSSKVPENRQSLALAHNNRAEVLRKLERREEAMQSYQKAQALQEKLVADFPTILRYVQDLGMTYNNMGDLLNNLGRFDDAIAVLEKALPLREKLAREHTTVPSYAVDVACVYLNMGISRSAKGQLKEALDRFTKAIVALNPVLSREPRLVMARTIASNAHAARAIALDNLARHAEALRDFDRALALDDGQKRTTIRLQRAVALVRSGDYSRATAEAEALAAEQFVTAGTVYDAACVYALCAAAARRDTQRVERYASRAVALLRLAVGKGFKDAAHMKKDPDLESLRSREDFKRLINGLEAAKH